MGTAHAVDESLLDSLRELRAEEHALMGLLDRADGTSNAEVLRDHRRRLGRIRQKIEDSLPDAFQMCHHCVAEAQRLRQTIHGLRLQLRALRKQAEKNDDEGTTKHAQEALRVEYNRVYVLLDRHEYYLSVLDEFLPGVPDKLTGKVHDGPPLGPEQRASVQPPPVVAQPPPDPVITPEPDRRVADPVPQNQPEPSATRADDAPRSASRKSFRADRRAHKRVPLAVPVRFRFNGQSYVGRTADVSMGGLFIETDQALVRGTEFTVLFCAAEGFPIELEARVMYVMDGIGVGVKFLHMPEEDQKYLEALINEIDSRGPDLEIPKETDAIN